MSEKEKKKLVRQSNFEAMTKYSDIPRIERLKMEKDCILECIEEYGRDGFIDMLWKVEKLINEEFEKLKTEMTR